MFVRLGLIAAGALTLVACERPSSANGVDPDMLRIAVAMQPCEAAGNAIPAALQGSSQDAAAGYEAAAAACAPVPAAIRALAAPSGDATAFNAAREACATEMDARMASLMISMDLNARSAAGTATTEDDLAAQQATTDSLTAREHCTAALGSPSYQLRRDAGLETAS